MGYVQIRSFHAVRTFTRDGGLLTLCGRRIPPPIGPDRVVEHFGAERSCETCLRALARKAEV